MPSTKQSQAEALAMEARDVRAELDELAARRADLEDTWARLAQGVISAVLDGKQPPDSILDGSLDQS